MRRSSKSEAERWIAQAKRDMDDARYNYDGNRFNVVCFLAQQAAEKAVKGFLIFSGVEFAWGHSVGELCRDAADFDPRFREFARLGAALDKFYIPARYPNGLPGGIPSDAFTGEEAESAIKYAKKIIGFAEELVES